MSYTVILDRDGNGDQAFFDYCSKMKSHTNAAAADPNSEIGGGGKTFKDVLGGIGPLSLTEPYHSRSTDPNSAFKSPFAEEPGCKPQWQDCAVDLDELPFTIDWGSGPCHICGGSHTHSVCGLRYSCPFDEKLGKGFKIVCQCGCDVINGECERGCSYKVGYAVSALPMCSHFPGPGDDLVSIEA